ncbi:MAG: tRNA dihydrouridine synthase DusB [Candidatus Algichlamydia australiensis]|nr:tRNA dihydrouridine synthase DusB [Chlamydiales bacterium]
MKKFFRPLKIGSLQLKSNIFYAPLAGCSDLPYRQMAQRYRPGIFFNEMVKMEALVRFDPGTYRLLDYEGDMHPIGAQLCGANPKIAAQAARQVEELGFDLLDLNCGCPVDKVTKDGSGSALLKNPEKMGEILFEMVNAVQIPVTVKIRMGWDDNHIIAPEITKIAEQAGAKMITIHGRTREQGYKGFADWSPIAESKKVAKEILVVGNGDIFDGKSALAIFEQTDCDGILISRGTLGAPWIFQDVVETLEGNPPPPKTKEQIKETLLEHLEKILAYQPTRRALLDLRRISSWYLKKSEGSKVLREKLSRIASLEEAREIINIYG